MPHFWKSHVAPQKYILHNHAHQTLLNNQFQSNVAGICFKAVVVSLYVVKCILLYQSTMPRGVIIVDLQ